MSTLSESSVSVLKGCPSGMEPISERPDEVAFRPADPTAFVRCENGLSRLELSISGAHCAGCIKKIEGAMTALPGMASARLSLSSGKLSLTWVDGAFAASSVTQRLEELGYRATPYDPDAVESERDQTGRHLLLCLAVAGFATANIMLLSIAVWAGAEGEMGAGTRGFMHLVSALIAIPAVAFAGRPFFSSAFSALRARHVNMDVPISLAVVLALGLSVYESVLGGHEAYFDAAVMLLFFLLIGRYLDHRLRARARRAATDLIALQATTANRLAADDTLEVVSARLISPGDRILLRPGDRVPVDGVIIQGQSSVDVSLVTGESDPVRLSEGSIIHAGVVNHSSALVMRASKSADESLVADLMRLMESGEQAKGRYVRLADKAASLYVPIVHVLALSTFLAWFFVMDAGVRVSLMNAVAVLIITCPCALGLATPAVQIVATGRLFKSGVLVKTGDALERLAEVDTFVFDKTGTLTIGKPRILNLDEIPLQILGEAASLARTSRHPLSRAIVLAAGAGHHCGDATETEGCGIEGTVNGEIARLGSASWVGVETERSGYGSQVWYKQGSRPAICFRFHDQLREDAAETLSKLSAMGLNVRIASGDRDDAVAFAADRLGVADWESGLSPREKVQLLTGLAQEGHKVAMVGDGLNDGPSLASAHVSLSPGTAADASQAAADFVYQGESMMPILIARRVAKISRIRVLENFGIAALYNMVAVPLAAFGFVTPLIAALAMSGSSLVVTLNALRLSLSPKERTVL